jgi:hypothetical protein
MIQGCLKTGLTDMKKIWKTDYTKIAQPEFIGATGICSQRAVVIWFPSHSAQAL